MYGSATQVAGADLASPERNLYFHGKLMDAYHFALETEYHQRLRRLINRLVLGYGVVCGLNVAPAENKPGETKRLLQVSDGFALDRWGREIIVPAATATLEIDDAIIAQAKASAGKSSAEPCEGCREHHKDQWIDDERDVYVHVVICYDECRENPMPVLAGDCNGASLCAPGTIREWYHVEIRAGHMTGPNLNCGVVDAVTGKTLNYSQLVRWVTFGGDDPEKPAGCPGACESCIPLANVRIPLDAAGNVTNKPVEESEIDIDIRPIVYPNDLLFEMFLDMATGRGRARMAKS